MALFTSIKFPYIKGKPSLTARVETPHGSGRFIRFLIDSGADYSVISKIDAMSIGINVDTLRGEGTEVEYANRESIKGEKVQLSITLGDEKIDALFIVAYESGEALLGRKGIFDKFDVLFQEKDQMVTFIRRL